MKPIKFSPEKLDALADKYFENARNGQTDLSSQEWLTIQELSGLALRRWAAQLRDENRAQRASEKSTLHPMKNYLVWSPERGLPSKTHAGIDAATGEASRLAALHPGVPFHVYGLIGTACASVSIDFTSACPEQVAPTPEKLAADEVAKGHNPLGLTNAEVGVADGWRLLEKDELWEREHVEGDGIEFTASDRHWVRDFGDVRESSYGWTFRTKNPPGHYRRNY